MLGRVAPTLLLTVDFRLIKGMTDEGTSALTRRQKCYWPDELGITLETQVLEPDTKPVCMFSHLGP